MEESIKLLKAFIKYNKYYKEDDGQLTITINSDLKLDIDIAITNVLTELEERIPISVIQNKIDELKSHNYKGNLGDVDFIQSIIKEFEELLEERK